MSMCWFHGQFTLHTSISAPKSKMASLALYAIPLKEATSSLTVSLCKGDGIGDGGFYCV